MSTRPAGVTLVAVLAWISGALNILSGTLVLVGAIPAGPHSVTVAGVAIAVGIIVLLVSIGLFRGSQVARVFTAISFAANLGGALWLMLTHPANLVSPVISAFTALIGLILLFTRGANEFFRG